MIAAILQILALVGLPIGAGLAFGPGGVVMALSIVACYLGLAMEDG